MIPQERISLMGQARRDCREAFPMAVARLAGAILTALLVSFGGSPSAAAAPVLEATFTDGIANGWVRVERWRDPNPAFRQEAFPPDGRGDQTGQRVLFFGSARPHSSRFLLYYAPGWDSNTRPTPVLLVHGATQNADQAWANPADSSGACGRSSCPTTGLMQALSNAGYRVFAINFPHPNGDGYFWSQQIAAAIDIVKARTGADTVDVIAWSKGGFNTRMYVSSLAPAWGVSYRHDVRRLILMGTPNNGFDWSFRHGTFGSLSVYPECGGIIDGPAVHDWMLCFGWWWYHPEWTYGSDYFPGSAQMLKRWDSVYSPATFEADWWTTYYGGWGFYSHSPGIDAYLGRSLVDDLRAAGIPPTVRVHLLCGNQNDIPLLHNEHTGPSDGVIFVASCADRAGISNIGGVTTLAVNHLELGWEQSSVAQILDWLAAP